MQTRGRFASSLPIAGKDFNDQKSDLLLLRMARTRGNRFVKFLFNFEATYPLPQFCFQKKITKMPIPPVQILILFESVFIDQKLEISLKPQQSPHQANHKIFPGRNPFHTSNEQIINSAKVSLISVPSCDFAKL